MPLLRRNVLDLSAADKDKYIKALWAMKRNRRPGAQISYFDEYALLHRTMTKLRFRPNGREQDIAHNATDFFPWHRILLAEFEAELQRQGGDPNLTLVYWDWTDRRSYEAFFSDDFMGAWVRAERSVDFPLRGVLQGWTRPNLGGSAEPELVIRNYSYSRIQDFVDYMNGREDIPQINGLEATLKIADFKTFWELFEAWYHGQTHGALGGSGDLSFLDLSANDPAFWSLHTGVDHYWRMWQEIHDKHDSKHHVGHVLPSNTNRSNPLGTGVNDYLYPWDNYRYTFVPEVPRESELLAPFLKYARDKPAVTISSQWNQVAHGVGYELERNVKINEEVSIDLRLRQSVLFRFVIEPEFSNAPVKMTVTGDTTVKLKLYGPANCDHCYGPASGQAGPGTGRVPLELEKPLQRGRYHLVVTPAKPEIDVGVFRVLVTIDSSEDDEPLTLPPRTESTLTTSPGAPAVVAPQPGPELPRVAPLRSIPLALNVKREFALPLHGAYAYHSFTITQTGRTTIEVSGAPVTNIALGRGTATAHTRIGGFVTHGDLLEGSLTRRLEPGRYVVVLYSLASSARNYTITVHFKH